MLDATGLSAQIAVVGYARVHLATDEQALSESVHPTESFHAVFALKALDSSGGIDQTLLPRVERMAIRAHFNADLRQGGTCFEGIAACARHQAAAVCGMDISFHMLLSQPNLK
jgi:hypothetical protein